MQKINVNSSPYNRIISVIRELGQATVTDIKRKIAQFNQSGGVEALRKYLADIVSNGTLTIHTEKSGNGQSVEYYRLSNKNDNDSSSNGNAGNSSDGSNPKININIEINFEGWDEIFALLPSLINLVNSNGGVNTESIEVDNEDSNPCEVDEDTGYDSPNLCEYDNELGYDEQWLMDYRYCIQ